MRTRHALLLSALLIGTPALAAPDPAPPNPPGFVDAQVLTKFAAPDAEVVEVNLSGSLLKALADSSAKEDPAEGRTLSKLHSIRAYIVSLEDSQVDPARKAVEKIAEELLAKGWEAIVKVRDKTSRVYVLVLNQGEHIGGLTVLVADDDKGENGKPELVFANIAGTMNLSELGNLDVPGLDRAGMGKHGADTKGPKGPKGAK